MKQVANKKNLSNKFKNNFFKLFDQKQLNKIAHQTGFCERKRKITPLSLVLGFFVMASKETNTFSLWAEQISLVIKKKVTKQSLFERVTVKTVSFIKKLIQQQIIQKYQDNRMKCPGSLRHFPNVFLQGSSAIQLPDKLVKEFPGSRVNGKRCAIARIDTIYNLRKNTFSSFGLESYNHNDLTLSHRILDYINKGDLVIRDLGFFKFDIFQKIYEMGAYFLTRKPPNVTVFDCQKRKRLDLIKVFSSRKHFDNWVLVGEKQIEMRLVAFLLPPKIVAERIRKAVNCRDTTKNHSKEYYQLLRYVIFLTNVPRETLSARDVADIYRFWWFIEIMFKSWKSCFKIKELIHSKCDNKIRVECTLFLMLLYITIFQVRWYGYFEVHLFKDTGKHISILKLSKFFNNHLEEIFLNYVTLFQIKKIINQHCKYETRKKRKNAMENYYKIKP